MPKRLILSLLLLMFAATVASADLSTVRYQKSGRGHTFLGTLNNVPIGNLEASIHVYLLPDRWVVTYTEHKRRSASESEVVAERELSGRGAGASLAGIGTLRVLTQTHNGKPVVELVLDQAISNAPRGTTFRLGYIYSSWAPKSVTGG